MRCDQTAATASGGGSDRLEGGDVHRHLDGSSTKWLIGQGVKYLNSAGKEAELNYALVMELLARREDLADTVAELLRRMRSGDAPLRWSLLHVLGDAGNGSAADYLVRTALEELPPAQQPGEGCEGLHDSELLVRTMAVVALQRVASRNREVTGHVLKLISSRPARAILIEAVKAGRELGLVDRIREVLPKEDQWMLDLRQARTQELFAEPERADGKERGFTPPKFGKFYTAPRSGCCSARREI